MKKRTITNLTILASMLCALLLLTGCGQKGPLFVPEPEQQTEPESVDSLPNKPKAEFTSMAAERERSDNAKATNSGN